MKNQFRIKGIDKDKQERLIFDFRNIEDKAERLRHENEQLLKRFEEWEQGINTLWAEVNTLKAKLNT